MGIQQHPSFTNLQIIHHPLVMHKLSILRDKSTCKKIFNELVTELTLLMGYEVTKNLELTQQLIETPLETCHAPVLSGKKPVVLPILRAGIGMVDGLLSLMPTARVGHIGLFRDEATLEPHRYYFKIPKSSEDRQFFVVDPMLATGGSAEATFDCLKEHGISRIAFMCLVASPQGVERLQRNHSDIPIFAASLDRELSDSGFILPGLGDAGDRLFGTQ